MMRLADPAETSVLFWVTGLYLAHRLPQKVRDAMPQYRSSGENVNVRQAEPNPHPRELSTTTLNRSASGFRAVGIS